ncbi:DNA/RNA nuclease SfsA [Dehalobacterium formicoaceticum]|uniref:Sugar fermentation stimulation protein homolog n=1 Tax=Dehalobacterium formicoaceticum TaxID=51515 RepID=A0ABT1Y0Q5_9FIRM|nr:DNA/RNA nuclease SfsA [Dehalobacterium formicoaceticum]MCR6544442.1 DNA/RNA nuclease SfsA [Dehalobacterium formicoaceticum]
MEYGNITKATFLHRPNRFIAHVLIDGKEEIVHVKNTGRCRELLQPEAQVILEKSSNPNRKTKYSLIAVYKGSLLVNIDSQAPNTVVFEGIQDHQIPEINEVITLKKEMTFGRSRFDLYFKNGRGQQGFIEVKGVTLENQGVAMFPDAPTLRGTKHIREMIRAVEEGYQGYIFFLLQMKEIKYFTPNTLMDPKFSEAISAAHDAGVKILAYDALVTEKKLILGNKIKTVLP